MIKHLGRPIISFFAVALALALAMSSTAKASSLAVLVGPTGAQAGGPNPVSFPPTSIYEYQFTYVTDSNLEANVSILPGILLGYRFRSDHTFLSLGGSCVQDAHGRGCGPYMAAGYISGKGAGSHFIAEFIQAAALDAGKGRLLSPFSVRIGVDWDY